MGWLKKKLYQKGPGSPGSTGKSFATQYQDNINSGMPADLACDIVASNYLDTLARSGVDVPLMYRDNLTDFVDNDPALAVFFIAMIANSRSSRQKQTFLNDRFIIMEAILEAQNKVLNQNRGLEEVRHKLTILI